ncbi:MAG: hypothetical protein C0490_11960, partial [Marivirga sp.]|nr:hypothetical protein [Marivirga sp.]
MKGSGWKLLFLLLIFSNNLQAQILKDLQKAAFDKAKSLNTKENRDKLVNAVLTDMENARSEFDSSDFDYAVLLSDNSGLFDIKEKGEGSARVTSMISLSSSYYKNSELKEAERARFNLEM